MNSLNLKFSDFTTQNQFQHLKSRFIAQDYKASPIEEIVAFANSLIGEKVEKKNLPDNPVIHVRIVDDANKSEKLIKKKFLEDYIIPAISNLAEKYYKDFQSELETKAVYGQESIQGFARQKINKLNPIIRAISTAEHLDEEIKTLILKEVSEFIDLIQEHLSNPYPNVEEKLKFKWNKTDVIYFFHLLRKNEIIKFKSDSDLGKLINEICCYYKPAKGEYLPITNSRKLLNEFENGKGRSIEPVNKRLKEIFLKEDFFNV